MQKVKQLSRIAYLRDIALFGGAVTQMGWGGLTLLHFELRWIGSVVEA